MPKIVHIEIPANDMGRARNFYSRLFGWEIEPWREGSEDYFTIKTGNEPELGGGMMKRRNPDQPITHYVDVDSLDTHAKKVEELGGRIIVPKMPVPNMGYFAVCLDTEQNVFGLWEDDPNAAFFSEPAEVFVALMLAVIAADEKYSVDEMRFTWYDAEQLDIFKGRDYKEIEKQVLAYFEKDAAAITPFTDPELDMILTSAMQLLDEKVREKAFETAVKVAYADKNLEGFTLDPDFREKPVLERIQKSFGIPDETLKRIAGKMKPV